MSDTQTKEHSLRFYHPAIARAKKFDEEFAAEQAAKEDKTTTAQPAVQAQVEAPAPAPEPPAASKPVTPVGDLFDTQPAAHQAQTQYSPEIEALKAELAARDQRQAELAAELESLRGNLSAKEKRELEIAQQLEEYQKKEEEARLQELISLQGVELETVDPLVSQELKEKVLRPLVEKLTTHVKNETNRTTKQLEEERAARAKQQEELLEFQQRQTIQQRNAKIYKAVPDFDTVYKSAEFDRYLSTPLVPGTSITLRTAVSDAYANDNIDYVIETINKFKQQGVPAIDTIASAPAVAHATSTPTSEGEEAEEVDITELNNLRATGKISLDEYRKRLAAVIS